MCECVCLCDTVDFVSFHFSVFTFFSPHIRVCGGFLFVRSVIEMCCSMCMYAMVMSESVLGKVYTQANANEFGCACVCQRALTIVSPT